MKNKRGASADVIYAVGFVFVIIVTAILSTKIYGEFNQAVQDIEDASQDVKDCVQDFNDKYSTNTDSGIILAFIGAHIAILILSIFLKSHPIMYPVLALSLIVVVILSAYVSNAYDEITSMSDFTDAANQYPISDWIMTHFILLNLIFGLVDIIAFAAFSALLEGGGGGGL